MDINTRGDAAARLSAAAATRGATVQALDVAECDPTYNVMLMKPWSPPTDIPLRFIVSSVLVTITMIRWVPLVLIGWLVPA
jgi:hypothetical protein